MRGNLEEKAKDYCFEYNFSDALLPTKMFRHVPKLIKQKDKFTKYYGMSIVILSEIAKVMVYYSYITS